MGEELIVITSWIHGDEPAAWNIKDDFVDVFEVRDGAIIIDPARDWFFVVARIGAWYADGSRRPARETGSHQVLKSTEIRCFPLIPTHAQMVDGQSTANFTDLLVGLFGSHQVVDREDHAGNIPQPFFPNFHGGPEASVKSSEDPGSTEVGGIVHVGHGLWTRQPYQGTKIPGRI
ncbi:hypothetical protein RRF57_010805 [Xylaria bambusicola]|uniref:Uncharacterized protein n=1 Tax=Xylaria bambusicola TaxID=326684 RepID=A0AAN7ZDG6_9PEZI